MTKDINNATLRLALYDPLQLDEKDFLNTFVARNAILKRLTRHVRENIGVQLLQHRLIFGQRGMGKTSLLRRIAISVKNDPTLAEHWIPLNFREEQYNIGKLDHFWQNCADALADWCEKQGDTQNAGQLDRAINTGLKLYETIQNTTKRYNRRLLLLVDNLNLILDSLSAKDQWTLREKLQAKDAPLMIGCTPSHITQLSHREGAFYDFFAIDDLKPLTPVEMRECLARLAQTRGEPGRDVLEDMRRYPARIQVMHTLCGGNPRTLVLIYQVLETIVSTKPEKKGDIGQLLEGVLENTTPMYKARTEELPPQQRRIIDAVALHWDPAHSSTIVEMTGLTASSISPLLKRLQNDGLLQQVSLGSNRRGFQLAERFYNIWYLMRHGTRRNRLRLSWLSSFLSTYYSNDELHRQAKQLITRGDADRNLYSESLMHAIDDEPLRNALRHELTRPLISWDKDSLLDLIPGEDYEPQLLNHAERQAKFMAGLRKKGIDDDIARQFTLLFAELITSSATQKQSIADKAEQLSKKQVAELIKIIKEQKQVFDKLLGKEASQALRQVFANGRVSSLDDSKGALAVLAYAESPALVDAFLMLDIFKNAEPEELSRVADACIATPPSKSISWNYLGILLKNHLQRFDESEQAYRKAIEIDPKYATPWNGLGNLLQDHLQRFDESEQAYRKAIEIEPKYATPWNGLGNLLQGHLQRFDESEQAYRKAIEIDPKYATPWNGLGNLLQDHLQRFEESKKAYLTAEGIDPKDQYPKSNSTWLALKLGDPDNARELATDITLAFPGKELILAGCDLVAGNPGSCCDILEPVLEKNPGILWTIYQDDLLRLTRLVKKHNFQQLFVARLHSKQLHISLEPYVAAAEAYFLGYDRLLRLNPEARSVAEPLYQWLISEDIK
jgi:tetratricopeptide (TPR) repeat protein